jgi:hypothetical protein
MKTLLCVAAILTAALAPNAGHAQLNLTTATANAYNTNINGVSFQQDALVTYNGYQYLVYWSANRHIALARRPLPDGAWESLELSDYQFQTSDAHYDISLGISPKDGTLHLSFDQWSSDFRYRRSVPNIANQPQNFTWNNQLFGEVRNNLNGPLMTPTTYPRFVTSPSGKLLLLLRHGISGTGDSFLYEYDGATGQWADLGKLVDGLATDVSAYFNGLHYDGNGRLHATWTWRETPNASSNHDLHYMYSDDEGRSWFDNGGRHIATVGAQPINENTPGIRVWTIGENRGLINQESQTVDRQGRVSMLMSHMRDAMPNQSDFREARLRSYVYHYLRDTNGQWSRRELPGSSFSYDRNKIAADSDHNLYAVINRDGIYRATAEGMWDNWELLHSLTDQSIFAEVQIDHQRLMSEGVLSFVTPATPGKMLVFDLPDESTTAGGVGGGPAGYEFCAEENTLCQFSGQRDVAFGAGGRFYHRTATGDITCNKDTFGEPIRGSVKRCYISSVASQSSATPAGYTFCAEEGQSCQFSGIQQVAYGANGQFHYRLAKDVIMCANTEFTDPYPQNTKRCYLADTGTSSTSSSSSSSASSSSSSGSNSSSSSSSASSSSSSSGTGGTAGAANIVYWLFIGLFLGMRAVSRRGKR